MDLGFINQLINEVLNRLLGYIAGFSETQWLLLILGAFITIVSIYYAWKAVRPASYKLSVMGAKVGLTLIVLAFAWPWAKEIYESAMQYTGNPVLSILAVFAGGFLGYRIIMLLFKRRKEVVA